MSQGGAETTKQILFKASQDPEDDFALVSQGRYELLLLAWYFGGGSPKMVDKFEIDIDELQANKLSSWLGMQITRAVVVDQSRWKDWRPGPIRDTQELLKKINP